MLWINFGHIREQAQNSIVLNMRPCEVCRPIYKRSSHRNLRKESCCQYIDAPQALIRELDREPPSCHKLTTRVPGLYLGRIEAKGRDIGKCAQYKFAA